MADGCIRIRNKTRTLGLYIKTSDEDHIFKFRDFLGAGQKIAYNLVVSNNGGSGTVGITVGSKRLVEALSKYGVIPNKTYMCKASNDLINDQNFWRGMIDGDGCVRLDKLGKPRIGICGTKEICDQFRDFCKTICPKINHKTTQDGSIWKINFANNIAANIIHRLYHDCKIALDRKLKVARQVLEQNWKIHPGQKWNLTEDIIKAWMQIYKDQKGKYPNNTTLGVVPCNQDYGELRWSLIDAALIRGSRGLEKGNSLAKLKNKMNMEVNKCS
jgi:hypothetical protein